jgi:hypothetical protein
MPSNLFLGLAAVLSVAGLSGAAAARPCLLGPDDRPAAARDAPAPSAAAKGHEPTVHPLARAPDPCDVDSKVDGTTLKRRKSPPRMLAPQRADH